MQRIIERRVREDGKKQNYKKEGGLKHEKREEGRKIKKDGKKSVIEAGGGGREESENEDKEKRLKKENEGKKR